MSQHYPLNCTRDKSQIKTIIVQYYLLNPMLNSYQIDYWDTLDSANNNR